MTQQTENNSQGLMIELKDMNKWYGEFHVLKNINLEVKKGEKIVICGPSGSGKSTMIRCINRLEEHQKGHIFVSGNELTEDLKNIEAAAMSVCVSSTSTCSLT
jgi:general L-amino acid transport system ATP-binding protein